MLVTVILVLWQADVQEMKISSILKESQLTGLAVFPFSCKNVHTQSCCILLLLFEEIVSTTPVKDAKWSGRLVNSIAGCGQLQSWCNGLKDT
jgi:hypothetical protein